MPKLFLLKNSSGTSYVDIGLHTLLKGIRPKVNVIARLGFELAYYDSAVQHVSHSTIRILPRIR